MTADASLPPADWCEPDDCPASICNGPHVNHTCPNGDVVTARLGDTTPCPFCGHLPPAGGGDSVIRVQVGSPTDLKVVCDECWSRRGAGGAPPSDCPECGGRGMVRPAPPLTEEELERIEAWLSSGDWLGEGGRAELVYAARRLIATVEHWRDGSVDNGCSHGR